MNMPHIMYEIVEETYPCNRVCRTSYGIVAYAYADEDGSASIIASVHDVSSDKERVLDLVRQCNKIKLSPIHLFDVVEDYLTEPPK